MIRRATTSRLMDVFDKKRRTPTDKKFQIWNQGKNSSSSARSFRRDKWVTSQVRLADFPAPRTAAATEPTSSLRKARTGNPPKPLPSVQRNPETRVTFVFDSNPIVPLTPRFDHSRSTVDLSVPAVTSPALRHGCRSLHRVQRRGGSFG